LISFYYSLERKMKRKYTFFAILTAVVLSLAACSPQPTETTPAEVVSSPAGFIAEGQIVPARSLEQAFNLSGQVAEVLVEDSEQVTEGQALAKLVLSPEAETTLVRTHQEELAAQQALDALTTNAEVNLANSKLAEVQAQTALDEAQSAYDLEETDAAAADLEAAKAALALAKDTLKRIGSGDGVDPDELEAAQARLKSAVSARKSAESLIEAHTLKANMAGSVVDLDLLPGQQVAAGTLVLTLADFTGWVVKTSNLTEVEVVEVQVGQAVNVIFDALPDVTLSGEVTHINARFEEKRGDITYTVVVQLDQPDARLRWGMTAAVQFVP
jgi:multidrug efflux pump subunit AcrA (membrane-fusion protein)